MPAASLALGVRFNALAAGSGNFVDNGAVAGYRTAVAGLVNGKTYRYRAEDPTLSEWEWGTGVWNSATSTLTRATLTFSSTGAFVAFSTFPQVAITIEPGDVLSFIDAQTFSATEKKTALLNIGAWTAGNARLTFTTVAAAGWILLDDGSIGNAASGATTRANADTFDLFQVLYNGIAALVVQDSSGATVARGASPSADFSANRRLVLPKTLGRVLGVAGSGVGLTTRTLGSTVGEETHILIVSEMPSHSHTGSGTTGTESVTHSHTGSGTSSGMSANNPHSHGVSGGVFGATSQSPQSGSATNCLTGLAGITINATDINHNHTYSFTTGTQSATHTHTYSFTTSSMGGDAPHNVMQPTTFLNVEVKL